MHSSPPSSVLRPRAAAHLVAALLLAACATPAALPAGRWIDLTHGFGPDTIYWPTSGEFELQVLSAERTAAGYWYAANRFCTAEHGGTHVDAPVHFAEGRLSVDRLPLERLIGPACVVDTSLRAAANPDDLVTVADLQAWEARHGRLPDGAIVLFRTGWGARWPDRRAYLGTERRGPEGVAELHFPGLHPDAALWLVEQRDVAAVGIDTASIDRGTSALYESHVILNGNDIPAFENVAALERLPEAGALVIALPMKIEGGSGGPLRIVALVPE